MDVAEYIPSDPEGGDWDVVVVGTGMGGSTLGFALARKGRRVLFVEKGKFLHGGPAAPPQAGPSPATEAEAIQQARLLTGWWPQPLSGSTNFGNVEFYAPLGCGSGGTTGHYGSQLERFHPCDFRPLEHFRDVEGADLPDEWPVTYAEMLPYYRQAESLFRVCGSQDPLNPDDGATLRAPPPLSERDQALHDTFAGLGLHPYRAHVGYEYVPDCYECTEICPFRCKREAGSSCLVPALRTHGAQILPECEVVELIADRRRVNELRLRRDGADLRIKAKTVVLAAGAYRTPLLLLNSTSAAWPDGIANRSGMVGRNLMLHTSDFITIDPPRWLAPDGPRKTLALNDFYLDDGRKLGTFQTVGFPFEPVFILSYLRHLSETDPRWWRKLVEPLLPFASRVLPRWFARSVMFATIVEDLPYNGNRIVPDPGTPSGMRFEYRYTRDLMRRNAYFRKRIARTVSRKLRMQVVTGKNNLNYGHVCGTCRFGDDADTSVLDRDNRAHELDNLYVVDASFFPSSGGTNPSLTIAANALRVADRL